jgi:hypothetical protein
MQQVDSLKNYVKRNLNTAVTGSNNHHHQKRRPFPAFLFFNCCSSDMIVCMFIETSNNVYLSFFLYGAYIIFLSIISIMIFRYYCVSFLNFSSFYCISSLFFQQKNLNVVTFLAVSHMNKK